MAGKEGRTGTHKNRSNQWLKGTAQRERVDKVVGFKPKVETYAQMQAEMEELGMGQTEWLDMVVRKHFTSQPLTSFTPPSCILQVKLLKLHCTYAGFIRAGALHEQTIKGVETRKTSGAIGKNYRGWVAIAASHVPEEPDWNLIKVVGKCAAKMYKNPEWFRRLHDPDLYKPGHILAVARVANVRQMGENVYPESQLEEMVGNWEAGNWAIDLEEAIAPVEPIPYNIPGQGAVFLTEEKHGSVYDQVIELITNRRIDGIEV